MTPTPEPPTKHPAPTTGASLPTTPTGRRTVIIVRPVQLTTTPDWPTGPLPLRVGDLVTTTQTRSTYFSDPCNRILYGTGQQPTRWHHPPATPLPRGVIGVEILTPDPQHDPHHGLAITHHVTEADDDSLRNAPTPAGAVHGDAQLDLLRTAAGRRGATPPTLDLDGLLTPFAARDQATGRNKPFTLAFRTSSTPMTNPTDLDPRLGWTPAQTWLWQLASRSTLTDYPPDPDHADRQLTGTVPLSADWRALINRDGAAFVALRPDLGEDDPYLPYAHLYTHTTYLDALLLGMTQRASVERMIIESAAAFDAPDLPRHLEQLQQRAARFRTIYWLRDASTHGHANNLLDAYHAQHELPQRFDTVLAEIADLARIVQARDNQRISAALGVLTIIGLPFGAALETLQALNANTPADVAIGLTTALAVSSALLTTRIGRLLIRQLRELR